MECICAKREIQIINLTFPLTEDIIFAELIYS